MPCCWFKSERIGWRVPAGIGVLLAMLLVSYATVVAVGFPVLEQVRPTARVARQLARISAPTAPVGLYRLERWRGSLRYYLNRPIDRLETFDELSAYLSRPEPVYVVMLRRDYLELCDRHIPGPSAHGTPGGHWHERSRVAPAALGVSRGRLKRSAAASRVIDRYRAYRREWTD